MSVILTILKVIGIILLVILGILLTVLLLVLFVPFRYRIHILKQESVFRVEGRVTWLLHLLRADVLYDEKKGTADLKVFGFRVKRFRFPKGAWAEEPPADTGKLTSGTEGPVSETEKLTSEAEEPAADESAGNVEQFTTAESQAAEEDTSDAEDSLKSSDAADRVKSAETAAGTGTSDGETLHENTDAADQPGTSRRIPFRKKPKTPDGGAGSKGLVGRIMDIVVKLADIAIRLIMKIPYLPAEIYDKLDQIEHKIAEKYDYILSKADLFLSIEAEHMFGKGVRYLLYLLRGYAPRKISGYIHFGTGSPDLTGKIAGLIFVLIPAAGDEYEVDPDFYESAFDTDTMISGVIRTYRMAWVGIRLLTDKEFWRLLRRIRNKDNNNSEEGSGKKKRKGFLRKTKSKKAA